MTRTFDQVFNELYDDERHIVLARIREAQAEALRDAEAKLLEVAAEATKRAVELETHMKKPGLDQPSTTAAYAEATGFYATATMIRDAAFELERRAAELVKPDAVSVHVFTNAQAADMFRAAHNSEDETDEPQDVSLTAQALARIPGMPAERVGERWTPSPQKIDAWRKRQQLRDVDNPEDEDPDAPPDP